MSVDNQPNDFAPVLQDAGDAVGVDGRDWFVAIVSYNNEKATAKKLAQQGYECYVATQKELRVWRNGKRKMIDRVVIGSTVFIHCTEQQRKTIVNLPYIYRFLTDKAGTANEFGKPIAVIPQDQINTLKFMLGQSENPVEMVGRAYGKGDRVRVIRGKLRGLEGEILVSEEGKNELIVSLDLFGCAKCEINAADVELVVCPIG